MRGMPRKTRMFKVRQKGFLVTDHRDTIDRLHTKHASDLFHDDKRLVALEKETRQLRQEIQQLEEKQKDPQTHNAYFVARKLFDKREALERSEKKKSKCQPMRAFLEYHAQVFPILQQYYANRQLYDDDPEQVSRHGRPIDRGPDTKHRQQFGAFSVFVQKGNQSKTTNKEALYKQYVSILRGEPRMDMAKEEPCAHCGHNQFLVNEESNYVCALCGIVHDKFTDHKPGYKEMQEREYRRKFRYERSNNFADCIDRAQGRERVDIPEKIMADLRTEIQKQNLRRGQITEHRVKTLLKHTGHNKYYKHKTHIRNKLLGTQQKDRFTDQQVATLKHMFAEVQLPFEKYCPDDRSSFLSYQYVLRKFCELLELDKIAVRFPYLKDRQKLRKHDTVWKNICSEVGYQFIPSL